MATMRIRLSGSENYQTKTLRCDVCGKMIIENHQANTPIYYVEDKENRVLCVDCNHNN
jgi:hypothetical protein